MPPKQNPTLYSISKTFIWFAIVSIVLTGCLVGIVMTDYNREWKVYQKKFVELKLAKAKAELAEADKSLDKSAMAELEKNLKASQAELNSHSTAIKKIEMDLAKLSTDITKAKTVYQGHKQHEDSYRYFFEEYRLHKNPKAAVYEKKLKELAPKLLKAKIALEEFEKKQDAATAEMATLESKSKEAKKSLDLFLAEKNRLQKKVDAIKPSLAKDVLNAPMLDFVAPTLRVQQIVLENLHDDYHFAKVQKVDRCTTCHLGIDQKGYEDAPHPFRTHPKLDLYLGSTSSHPIEKVGCTVCHGGNGHSVSFVDTAHTPKDEHQAEEWKKKYRWHELEKWENKMLPSNHSQAACAKCHTSVVEIPQADKLNRGKNIAQTMGCFNCHKIKGYEDYWKVGPDLTHVETKVSAEWVRKWLDNPQEFRPGTKMPQIFHLSNTSSPADIEKNKASIVAIAAYLSKNSDARTVMTSPKMAGDKEQGEKLVKTLGCLACHTAAGTNASHFGPELTGLGSKVSSEWLFDWLKDPKKHAPDTRMPNLRLSDEEAAHITAYLMSLKNETFDSKADIVADPHVIDELMLTDLQATMRRSEAEAELQKMSADEKLLRLGKKAISHQGCYTCHSIKGFDGVKPIGAELSNEGRKDIHQFDFGFIHMEHTRHGFISQKLRDPRIYDQGKDKAYYDKLRMPKFDLTEEQIDDLTTFILSLTEEQIPLEMQRKLSVTELETEKGRLLVSKLNCTGCHTLDGKEGVLRQITEDPGQAPPALDGEGSKVQESWLYGFLKNPTPIRPWLSYRMPTFGFDHTELTTLNKYFNHLSHEEISYAGYEIPATTEEKLAAGKLLFDTFQCAKCHEINAESSAMGSSFLAPDLGITKHRLKAHWVSAWLEDPAKIQEGTMMPAFFTDGQSPMPEVLGGDAKIQIEAIRDYLYRYQATPAKKESVEEVKSSADNLVA